MDSLSYLRTHSYYGFLESLLSPEALVNHALANNIPCLGLTDHRYLTGAIEFYETCIDAGVKPILGLEIDLTFQGYLGQLTLLAKDRDGWANLSRMSNHMLVSETTVDLDLLSTHQGGLIAIVGDYRGIFREIIHSSPESHHLSDRFLDDLQSIFQEDCFIEIQRYVNGPLKSEALLKDHAKKHNLSLLATQNIFYGNLSDEALYRTLTAIRHLTSIHGLSKSQLPPGGAYFPAPEDFSYRFHDLPEAVENLKIIQEKCNLELPVGETHFPSFPTPQGETQAGYLHSKAYEGAKKIYKNLTKEITSRLDYELEVITGMGYEPIFLIVEDVLNHARELGIPTSSRGSAASSLVAHCLNITSPDPLALNLYFERFLNPARKNRQTSIPISPPTAAMR